MNDQIRTAANEVATATDRLLAVTGQATIAPAPQTVMDKLHALPDGKANGLIPMARVNTRNGVRGVFWKGNGKNNSGPTVGLRKITKAGRLYRRNKYDGTFFVSLVNLENEGRNS